MATIQCKMCGGTMDLPQGVTSGECPYCGSLTTFPNLNDEKREQLYNRAEHFRRLNDFDKAVAAYESLLQEDDSDPEAYWGLVLSRFGIEYIIAIGLWGIYVIAIFILLQIPTAAIKVIGAGLATGLGFAMKDILNNFFYGVQLMSGRVRVGDYIECDGIRGKVDSINYQTTQIIATDGAVMAFPNTTLFNKNFKNLTRNHSYELLSFDVGVKYGVDVDQVRGIIQKALEPLMAKDMYGRDIVDPKYGIQVRFKDFGDNSVNLSVYQYITVEEHYTYPARAKELVYNALNAHGIEIPFPQRDLYIKSIPEKP